MSFPWKAQQIQLIAAVKEYPEIYDQEYRQKTLIGRSVFEIWEEVAKKVKMNAQNCKKQWRYFKRAYILARKKQRYGKHVTSKYLDGTLDFIDKKRCKIVNEKIETDELSSETENESLIETDYSAESEFQNKISPDDVVEISSESESDIITLKPPVEITSDNQTGTKKFIEPYSNPGCVNEIKNSHTVKVSSESAAANITKELNEACSKPKDGPANKQAHAVKEITPSVTILTVDDVNSLLMKREEELDVDSTIMQHLLNLVTDHIDETLNLNTLQDNYRSPVVKKCKDLTHVDNVQKKNRTAGRDTVTVDSLIEVVQRDLQSKSDVNVKTNNDPAIVTIPTRVDETKIRNESKDFVTIFDLHNNSENTVTFFKHLDQYIQNKFPNEKQKLLRLKICSLLTEFELAE